MEKYVFVEKIYEIHLDLLCYAVFTVLVGWGGGGSEIYGLVRN